MRFSINTKPVTVNTVVGGKSAAIKFHPNELIFDNQGVVRIITMRMEDGAVGNFQLMPQNKNANMAINVAQNWLIPFGLSVVGGKIMKGKSVIDHLTKWLTVSRGGAGLTDLVFDPISLNNSAYFEMTSGELVFDKPIILTPMQQV
ncbi:MAG: hypothetical protein ABL983_12965 [Nitrospira sp.]